MGARRPLHLRPDTDKQPSKITHGISLVHLYIICSFACIAMTIAVLFASHGELFNQIFFRDVLDTGMDFFHSIEYTKGRAPYELFNTLYPPLANLLFYVLFRFVPEWQHSKWATTFIDGVHARGTDIDLRVWQPTMLIFIIYVILSAVLVTYMVQACVEHRKRAEGQLVGLCILLSQSMLYAYERGNIIVLAWLCAMFFIHNRNSEKPILRELALLSLAVSAGLKIYPALLGVLLLYDKQYIRAMRAIIYGVTFFVLPSLLFKEGLSGLMMFFKVLLGHSEGSSLRLGGYDFSGIANSFFYMIQNPSDQDAFVAPFGKMHNVIISVFMLMLGFFMKKKWQQVMLCSMAMLLFQSQGTYGMIFMLLSLLVMLDEETALNWHNVMPFIAVVGSTVLFPLRDVEIVPYSMRDFRLQVGMVVLCLYFFVETVFLVVDAIKKDRK